MTREELLRLKIQALLHDPPQKAGVLMQAKERHEKPAARLVESLLGSGAVAPEVNTADHIASGADRYNFPGQKGQFAVRFLDDPRLRHPLSGAESFLPSLKRTGEDALELLGYVNESVEGALARIKDTYGHETDEARRLWLYALSLWRELPDLLQQPGVDKAKLGALWTLLPGDTRIPDHSIWEHLSLTSALVGAGIGKSGVPSTASLLLFSIGPVQDFIGAARKTSDLHLGSYLLSYLTWQAIRVVAEACGPDAILFPDLRRQPLADHWLQGQGLRLFSPHTDTGAATIPNRFFAVVPGGEADGLARAAECAVRKAFEEIGEVALTEVEREASMDGAFYREQLRSFFECTWSVLPLHRAAASNGTSFKDAFKSTYSGFVEWDSKEADAILDAFEKYQVHTNIGSCYGRLYRLTDTLVGRRKGLREFTAAAEEPGYRCSLLPQLAAIVPAGGPDPGEVGRFWDRVARRMSRGRLRRGEQLSAVALARRFLPDYRPADGAVMPEGRFPSTGSIATADFKADVLAHASELQDALRAFRAALNAAGALVLDPQAPDANASPPNPDKLRRLFTEVPMRPLERLAGGDDLRKWFAALDGGWLFDEAYDAARVEKEYAPQETEGEQKGGCERLAERLEQARRALDCLLKAADALRIARPSKYYVLLKLDGDHMGRWLSGAMAPSFGEVLHPSFVSQLREASADVEDRNTYEEWLDLIESRTIKRPLSPALHLAISRALGTFALDLVPRATEHEHRGHLVFSGGDDVLAFVSFRDALPLARTLRAAFSGQVVEEAVEGAPTGEERPARRLRVDWGHTDGYVELTEPDGRAVQRRTMGHTASASAGLVFAHYRQSFQQVVAAANRAEHHAKRETGRDALAVCVMKRSGETLLAGTHWCNGDEDVAEALARFAEVIRSGLLSTRFVYDLDAALEGLEVFEQAEEAAVREKREQAVPAGPAPPREATEPIRLEVRRLFLRHTETLRPEKVPDWLRNVEEEQRPARAFEETVRRVLNANPLRNAAALLDAAQFLGLGGDR